MKKLLFLILLAAGLCSNRIQAPELAIISSPGVACFFLNPEASVATNTFIGISVKVIELGLKLLLTQELNKCSERPRTEFWTKTKKGFKDVFGQRYLSGIAASYLLSAFASSLIYKIIIEKVGLYTVKADSWYPLLACFIGFVLEIIFHLHQERSHSLSKIIDQTRQSSLCSNSIGNIYRKIPAILKSPMFQLILTDEEKRFLYSKHSLEQQLEVYEKVLSELEKQRLNQSGSIRALRAIENHTGVRDLLISREINRFLQPSLP